MARRQPLAYLGQQTGDEWDAVRASILADRGETPPTDELNAAAQQLNRQDSFGPEEGLALSDAADMITGVKGGKEGYQAEIQRAREGRAADVSNYERVKDRITAERRQSAADADKATEQQRYAAGLQRAAEETAYTRGRQDKLDERQAKMDELAAGEKASEAELRQAQIAKMKAEAVKLGRPAGGGDPLAREKKLLELQELRQKLAGGGKPMDPLRELQIEKARQDVTGEDPKKVRAAQVSSEKMSGLINKMRDLYSGPIDPKTGKRDSSKGYGSEMGGEGGQAMNQTMTAIKLEAKNLAELGALSGPDQKLMEDLAGADPTSWSSNLRGLVPFLSDNVGSALKNLEGWSAGNRQAAERIYGPHQGGTPGAQPAPGPINLEQPQAPQPPFVGAKRVRRQDGKLGWWDGKSALPPGTEVVGG